MNPINQQYIRLYEENAAQLGQRPDALNALSNLRLSEIYAPDSFGLNLQGLPMQVDAAQSFRCAVPAVSAAPALSVNDFFQAPKMLPEGVTMMSLKQAAKTCPQLIPQRPVGALQNADTALNDLLWNNGILIHVKQNCHLSKPLQLVNILAAPIDLLSIRRIIIVLEANSKAQILLCDHTQDAKRNYLVNELIEVTLHNGSQLTLDRIEEASALTLRRSVLNASIQADATLRSTAATLNCGDSHCTINVNLNAPGASASVNGMVIASSQQKPAFVTHLNHCAHHTSSRQLFKYVADGASQCSFQGLIVVKPGAEFTEAYQTNHNILASPQARMHGQPALEIYCDEVKCSHGATTGQLDPAAIFYMQQRGIPQEEARQMLMEAFLVDVIDQVGVDSLRDRLRFLVERRFCGMHNCTDCQIPQ